MNAIYILLLIANLHIVIYAQIKIVAYSDDYHRGDKAEIPLSTCANFPSNLTGKLTSIDTKSNCARLYDDWNCTGSSIEVLPLSPDHHNLHSREFNDRAKSVSVCRDKCIDTEATGKYPDQPIMLQLFDRQDFKGAHENVAVDGCTLIPPKLYRRVSSVKTNGNCFQIYKDTNCKSKDSIELRVGTPHHNNLQGGWSFGDARSVSHCTYACNKTLNRRAGKESPSSDSLKIGEVLLFSDRNYQGNWIKIHVDRCINLTNEWEGVSESIRMASSSCVTLFTVRGCKGESLNFEESQADFLSRNFEGVSRSIRPCSPTSSGPGASAPDHAKSKTSDTTTSISPLLLTVIIAVPLLGVIFSVILVLYILRRCHPYKDLIELLSEKEIEEFIKGLRLEISENAESGDYSAELLAQNVPYNDSYEIPRSNIKFDPKSPLGMGEFGVVYKGSVNLLTQSPNGASSIDSIPVAIKTTRPSSGAECTRTLLKEVKVLLYVGKHAHIVEMIGCCTENLRRKGEMLVLMEFCQRGSLEMFLQKKRSSFRNIVHKGKIADGSAQREHNNERSEYQNWDGGIDSYFDIYQLLRWTIEIAEGMEYLASKKVIHSDLAARNVLLGDNYEAKICDFGLSKQLYCYTQYMKKRQEPLPWRWLAMESLKNLEFSTSSDVWSFGVLCWEIFNLGDKPYPGIVWSNDFLRNLEDGLRLGKPKYALTECYNVMLRCWEEEPNSRPSFTELNEELKELLDSITTSLSQTNLMYAQI